MSDKQMKMIDVADAMPQSRKSPAALLLENLPEGYLSTKDMSERYGVHIMTIRRLAKATNEDGTPKVRAPSKAIQQGGLLIYVYTPEDVAEMDQYMGRKGYHVVDTA